MIRAIWNDTILAEAERTIVVEGNHYFAPDSVRTDLLASSKLHTPCFWKGLASYYNLNLDGNVYKNAAWHYPHPFIWARFVRGRVAFSPNVRIEVDSLAAVRMSCPLPNHRS